MKLPSLLALVACSGPITAQSLGVQFDHGVDEHIDVPYDPLLLPQTGLTVEAWIRYDEGAVVSGTYAWPTVLRQNPAPGQESYFLRVGASVTAAKVLDFKIATTAGSVTVSYPFLSGGLANWTHVAATYDGAALTMYIDGVEVATKAGTGAPLVDNGGELRIGNGDVSAPGAETWSGDIDEVRIWPFARTQAEIVQTKDDMIASMPGRVLTFNLESHYLDSSSGLVGTATGTPTFVPTIPLSIYSPAAGPFGTETTSCDPIPCGIGSKPLVPFPDFTVHCLNAPPSAQGFLAIGLGALAAPVPLLGVDVWVDPATLLIAAPIQSDALGHTGVNIGIDPDPGLIGVTTYLQFLYVDGACGPQGLTGSEGLFVQIF